MARSLSYMLTSLLYIAFLAECFACRMATSNDKNFKMQFTKDPEDGIAKAISRSSKRNKWKNQSWKNRNGKPNYITDDSDGVPPSYYTIKAVASQVEGQYYGTKATMDVYNLPETGKNKSSYGMINVFGYKYNNYDFNEITVGWHVDPDRYGDQYTHFFIAYEEAHRHIPCINLECQGFVLSNSSKIVPGNAIQQSPGKGKSITLEISKSHTTGDWLVHYEQDLVGYWQKSLFTCLDHASLVYWGGQVIFLGNERSPPMGSGIFPLEDKDKAASIWNVTVIEKNGQYVVPTYGDPYNDDSYCYQVINEDVIFYGGPAGCPGLESNMYSN